MCVICVKDRGVKMPTIDNIKKMWETNPHGAGFMYARDGKVYIRKGFMNLDDYLKALDKADLGINDTVVMHFRISTQGGINPEMTHPFALSKKIENTKVLNAKCEIGVAHNGIIRMTSNGDKEYSDTAIFIAHYMSKLIRNNDDFYNEEILEMIEELGKSKFVLLNGKGDLQFIGNFQKMNGLYYSNLLHELGNRYYERRANNGYKGYWNNIFATAK